MRWTIGALARSGAAGCPTACDAEREVDVPAACDAELAMEMLLRAVLSLLWMALPDMLPLMCSRMCACKMLQASPLLARYCGDFRRLEALLLSGISGGKGVFLKSRLGVLHQRRPLHSLSILPLFLDGEPEPENPETAFATVAYL